MRRERSAGVLAAVVLFISQMTLPLIVTPAEARVPGGYTPPSPTHPPAKATPTKGGGAVGVANGLDGPGQPGGGSARPSKPVYSRCDRLPVSLLTTPELEPFFDFPTYDPAQLATATSWTGCKRLDNATTDQFLTQPPQPDAELLVTSAESQLTLDVPDVATSPPRGGTQLVAIPIWFWIENSQPTATTATIPGLSATLTATPATTHIAITGGTGPATADNITINCPDGGTPWVEDRYDPWAHSNCSHPFDWNDTYTINATVDWNLTWTATNGQAGTLPTTTRTTTFTLTIHQAQAVTD